MARFKNRLNHIQVAAPCKADWNQMIGSEQVRFCGQCNLNVYNLSGMSRVDAESLIARTEGRLCVRFYRRRDGSIITQDCPVGLRAIQRRVSYLAKAIIATAFTFLASVGLQSLIPNFPMRSPVVISGMMVAPASVVVPPPPFPQEFTMWQVMIRKPSQRSQRKTK
jgi:hypothetical protein